jgi:oligosaccharide repeat unit polymerase
MLLLAISVLVLLALANYWLERRILYPPVVFCGVWAFDIAVVWLSGDLFFMLSEKTLAIFCGGALAFSLGSALASLAPLKTATPRVASRSSIGILRFLVVALVCTAPFMYLWMAEMASRFQAPNFFMAAYMAMLAAYEAGESSVLFNGVLTLSAIVAMIAFLEWDRFKKTAFLAVLIGIGMGILTGERAGVIGLIFILFAIDWMKNQRIRWKVLASMVILFLLIATVLSVLVGKAGADPNASVSENRAPIRDGLALYAVGGIVGFDRVVRQPNIIAHTWQINRFFHETANKFGAHFEVPIIHAAFVDVGPQLNGNVYTMYFAYIDLGLPGMMAVTAFIGIIVGISYRKGLQGSNIARLIYAYFFECMLLAPYSEKFFLELNFSLKILAVSWLVYELPRSWAAFTTSTRRAVVRLAQS